MTERSVKAVLLETPELDAYEQMALDEALLNAAKEGELILRFYRWPEESTSSDRRPSLSGVTFGYFQSYPTVVQETQRRYGVLPLLARRLTGGGIVFHDGDITFSVVFPWSEHWTPSLIYKDLHRGVHLGLKSQGLRSRLWSPPGCKASSSAVCFAEPAPIDLVHEDGRKFLGGALRKRKGIGLYQGSMRPEAFDASKEKLAAAVVEGLSLEWKTIFRPHAADARMLKEARRLTAEKYATQEWNQRR